MNKYTILFVLSLTISELGGQVFFSGIIGPAVSIQDVRSFNGKGTSVMNRVNEEEEDESKPGVERGPEVLTEYNRNNQNSTEYSRPVSPLPANYELGIKPAVKDGAEQAEYQQSSRPIANAQKVDRQWNYYTAAGAAQNFSPTENSIQTMNNDGDRKSSAYITSGKDRDSNGAVDYSSVNKNLYCPTEKLLEDDDIDYKDFDRNIEDAIADAELY